VRLYLLEGDGQGAVPAADKQQRYDEEKEKSNQKTKWNSREGRVISSIGVEGLLYSTEGIR
jgi:hypothetical protein